MLALLIAKLATTGAALSMSAGLESVAGFPATSVMVPVRVALPAASVPRMFVLAVQDRNPLLTLAGLCGKNCRDAPSPSVSVNVGLGPSWSTTVSGMRKEVLSVPPSFAAGSEETRIPVFTVMSAGVTVIGG